MITNGHNADNYVKIYLYRAFITIVISRDPQYRKMRLLEPANSQALGKKSICEGDLRKWFKIQMGQI